MIRYIFNRIRSAPLDSVILLAAVALRAVLCLVNRDANDNHVEVIQLLLRSQNEGKIAQELWWCATCYHPKLYHSICMFVADIFQLRGFFAINLAAQIVSFAMAVVMLMTLRAFLRRFESTNISARNITFALIAFNPSLTAIQIQATNDSMVIAFGVLTSYWCYRYFTERALSSICFAVGFVTLALLTKGNALVVYLWMIICVVLSTMIHFVRGGMSRRRGLCALGIMALPLLLILSTPNFIAPYRKYFALMWATQSAAPNFLPARPPSFFEEDLQGRPGVTSILNSYLTFRIIDLIRLPIIMSGPDPEPIHRTSLWSQLYGRYHFSLFSLWPPGYGRYDTLTIWLGRILLFSSLIPTGIFVYGFCREIAAAFNRLFSGGLIALGETPDWIFPLLIVGFLLAIVAYTSAAKDFASMKDIYMFPGFAAYAAVFLRGLSAISKTRWLTIYTGWVLFLYLANSTVLYGYLIRFF